MKSLKVLLAATLIVPCYVIAQVPVATFEGDELKIPSLILGDQNYKDIVMKYLGGMDFDVTQIQETTDPIIHSSSIFESGKLVVNALELGNEAYANLLFDYVGGTSLKLKSFKGPVKGLSFKQTDFSLVEPKEWKTTERVYNGNKGAFDNYRHDLMVADFPLIDLDRDGLKDIIIVGTKWSSGAFVDEAVPLRWLKNTGDGFELGDSDIFPESTASWILRFNHVADFNNDGFDDFVGVDTGYDGEPFPGGPNLLLLSKKEGGFEDRGQKNELFEYKGFSHALAVGDVNNDGTLDIATSDVGGIDAKANKVSTRILLNDGSGNFTLSTSFQNLTEGDGPYWQYGTFSLSLIDLNEDNNLDLVVGANEERTKDRIFWGNSEGEYTTSNYTVLPDFFDNDSKLLGNTMFALGTDLDFDGDFDLVLAKTNKAYQGSGMQFLINDGARSFRDETSYYSPIDPNNERSDQVNPFYLDEIDINLDGLSDLKLSYDRPSYSEDGETKIFPHFWIKQQDGSYEELSSEILDQKGWFWLIDYDEDGDIDIINRSSRFQQRSGEESYLSDEIFEWRILENESL